MGRGGEGTYSVCSGEFLFGADDGAGALGCVECGVAFDDSFAVTATAAGAGFAADAGHTLPVLIGHCGMWFRFGKVWGVDVAFRRTD